MTFKHSLKTFVRHYFIIYTCSMFVMCFFLLINGEGTSSLNLKYIYYMMLYSLLGDLPIFVFVSNKELSDIQMKIRHIIHFILLSIVLLIAGYFFGLYTDALGGVLIFVSIIVVYFIVSAVSFGVDFSTAKKINEKLKKINKK